ncbi:MAG: cation diffusion facilitator family transporter [Solirubrobacterales bacterium]
MSQSTPVGEKAENVITDVAVKRKTSAAMLSIASNTVLIALKVVAGAITGSIAILTEAVHSAIDLMASIIAYASVRKSGDPPDREHPYGHEKIENLAAVVEGMLILVGAAIIFFEATRRLVDGSEFRLLGVGIGVMAISMVANIIVSTFLARRARETDSQALHADAAHLSADAYTSGGVLVGLILVQVTGWNRLDSIIAMIVACAIVFTAVRILARSSRVLVDETLPDDQLEMVRLAVLAFDTGEILSYHKLRARGGESGHRYIDLHVQFADGTSLERAHDIAHVLQENISTAVGGADVLIHLEPATSSRPDDESPL